jgi:DNA (cytosine-5)-methyltransferase 1
MQPFAVANCLTARMHKGINSTLDERQTPVITQAITQFGETAGTLTARHDSSPCADRGMNVVAQPIAFHPSQDPISSADGTTHGLGCGSSGGQASVAVAIDLDQELNGRVELAGTLQRKGEGGFEGSVMTPAMAVRRLTPVECERLQGFPDNYTNIPWRKKEESPDGPRYKALGNSWAVPVVAWIGKRIQEAL